MSLIVDINEKFIHPYIDFSSQNSLTALIQTDLNKIIFILSTAYKAFLTIDNENNRFQPNPIIYLEIIYGDIINKTHLDEFFNITNNTEEFMRILLLKFTNDDELCNYFINMTSLGNMFIKLLYFFIFTNTIAFSSFNLSINSANINIYKITHSEEKEREFFNITTESKILLHGTSCRNIYSIMKNGIKVMSGTNYEINGSIYGNGIYLTNNISTAYSYSRERLSKNEKTNTNTHCILVFDTKNLNYKDSRIECYVQQENECILRFILWINTYDPYNNNFVIENIMKYAKSIVYVPNIMTIINDEIRNDILTIPNATMEPLSSERVINSSRYKKEITLNFLSIKNDNTIIKSNYLDPNNNKTPLLVLLRPDEDTDLAKDLVRYDIPGILLAIYFPNSNSQFKEYPNTPPKIRVISPIFIDGTGRVTKGGSLCADILYPEGWSPANTIEKILRNLIISIATEGSRNGPGRVDPNRLGMTYRYEDFLKSFNEVAGFHGFTAI